MLFTVRIWGASSSYETRRGNDTASILVLAGLVLLQLSPESSTPYLSYMKDILADKTAFADAPTRLIKKVSKLAKFVELVEGNSSSLSFVKFVNAGMIRMIRRSRLWNLLWNLWNYNFAI